ncbi:hypothetical protein BZG36_04477 [Bifiguratus adelaidae]|uniref:Beta-mannosidase B n=1 Tax=Bifiguratus adelaidae TaxID=1938954 RepID=A0A261XVH0_9FUNG|nr:hypothetical protein BZG36_04477 [Bifiguratus adelaidae]
MNTQVLSSWSWKQSTSSQWHQCAHTKPTTQIHNDLVDAKVIPDYLKGLHERDMQWVGEVDWEYKTTFTYMSANSGSQKDLVFDGLDTYATVYLNGKEILKSDNMFHMHRIDVREILVEGENELRIYFESALLKARQIEKADGKHMVCWNGESCRLYIRKAQYHFGWDWGPVLMTCGPYREVRFETYDARFEELYGHVEVDESLKSVVINVSVKSEGVAEKKHIRLLNPDGNIACSKEIPASDDKVTFELSNPQLWYPHKYGSQPLYTLEATLLSKNSVKLHELSKRIGLRRARLVQQPLDGQPGTSFFFEVNNIPIYCAGSNWIPAHSMLTSLTRKDYREWLQLMVDGNQDMLRVWGGGVYESDDLYSQCDELGILVWQDFMFGCGQYPCYPELAASIKREAEQQLSRLRDYCCIVIYAGNNEDYQVAESNNLEWDPEDHSGDWTHTNFPARTIYETILPNAVAKVCPGVYYHPGSPWGGNGTTDKTIGDIHQWNVWHGSQEKYQNWAQLGGRFISEFGMQGLPDIKTIDDWLEGDETERYPQSRTMDHHNKAGGFERRIALYVTENLRIERYDMESWVYVTQLMQAECLAYAYRCWRREWKGRGKEYIAGALVWQLDDCWPCTSWAICDFYRRPKLAYYAIKRESAPIALGLYRNEEPSEREKELANGNGTTQPANGDAHADGETDGESGGGLAAQPGHSTPFDYSPRSFNVDIWGVNTSATEVAATLEVDFLDVASGKPLQQRETSSVTLGSNQSTSFITGRRFPNPDNTVIIACLRSKSGEVLFQAADWPQPLKYLKFPGRKVHLTVEQSYVEVQTDKPVKGVQLQLDSDTKEVFWEDNGFDLFPGEVKRVNAPGLEKNDSVSFRFYGQYSQ